MSAAAKQSSFAKPAVVLVIVSFLLSTLVSLFSLQIMSRHNARETNKVLATQVYDYMHSELSQPIMTARTMAHNSFLIDVLRRELETDPAEFERTLSTYLASVEDGLGYTGSFVISNTSLRYFTREGYTRTLDPLATSTDRWYTTFVGRQEPYDLDVDTGEDDKSSLMVYVNAKVNNAKKVMGVCGVAVRMTGIQEMFRTFEQGFSVKINLVDPTGMVQVDTNTSNIEQVCLADLLPESRSADYVYEELGGDDFAVTKYVEDLDWYLVVRSNGADDLGQFANIIIVNIVICLFVLVAMLVALHITRRRATELHAASFIDHATGIPNKRSFEYDKADLLARGVPADLACLTADVNGLKTVNDTLGHDAGDELISGAARCLQGGFGSMGTVYRIGGDEFAGFLRVPPDVDENDLLAAIDEQVAAWSGSKVDTVSISCGFAFARDFAAMNVDELLKVSDERMYAAKNRYYEHTGKPRR